MQERGEVLVAIINQHRDFLLASEKQWYRIPVESQAKWLKERWPPRWLAFYQTKVFGNEAYSIRYFAKVKGIQEAYRWQLFPEEKDDPKATKRYYQLWLEPLRQLPHPIFSRRRRRLVFIPTTLAKFHTAAEINDLYDESALEDHLWNEFKRLTIGAERQELVTVATRNYFLDFAIYCGNGKIDVETDGDEWHANSEKAALDNLRDNDLESRGWQQLRFTTKQIREELTAYCVPKIVETINYLGGIHEEDELLPRKIDLNGPGGAYQLGLFDSVS